MKPYKSKHNYEAQIKELKEKLWLCQKDRDMCWKLKTKLEVEVTKWKKQHEADAEFDEGREAKIAELEADNKEYKTANHTADETIMRFQKELDDEIKFGRGMFEEKQRLTKELDNVNEKIKLLQKTVFESKPFTHHYMIEKACLESKRETISKVLGFLDERYNPDHPAYRGNKQLVNVLGEIKKGIQKHFGSTDSNVSSTEKGIIMPKQHNKSNKEVRK